MVISNYLGYSNAGQGPAYWQRTSYGRPAVTLEAERDPATPHQYAVNTRPQVIPPPERPSDAKYTAKKPNQNTDPGVVPF